MKNTSLGDCLTLLSKYQLEEIANHHKIQNPSKIKKAEFASMSMLSFCIETFKKEPLLVSYEKKFEKR